MRFYPSDNTPLCSQPIRLTRIRSPVVLLTHGGARTLLAILPNAPAAAAAASSAHHYWGNAATASAADYECGIGGASAPQEALRNAVHAAVTRARALKLAALDVHLPAGAAAADTDAVVQSAILSNYAFDRYVSDGARKPWLVSQLHFRVPAEADAASDEAAQQAVWNAVTLAHGTVLARDLCNERADEMNPERLECVARAVAAESAAFEVRARCE